MGAQLVFYHSQLIYYELFWRYLEEIYGKTTMLHNRWSSTFAEPNIIICKISLALFVFPPNARIFHRNLRAEYTNIKGILHIHNTYAEITWKYLIYRYGYDKSIKQYLHIIEWFLALTAFIQCAHHADIHVNDVDSLVEQTEIALILDDVDKIVENH